LLILVVRRLSDRGPSGHRYRWKPCALGGGAAAGVVLLSMGNRWPALLAGYNTTKPLESYLTQALLGRLMQAALLGCGLFLATLAADVFLQLVIGGRPLRSASVVRAAAVFALAWGLTRALSTAGQWLPGPRLSLPLWNIAGTESYFPAISVLSSAYLSAVFYLCMLAVVVSAAQRYLSFKKRCILVAVVALLYAASHSQNAGQFGYGVLVALLWIGLLVMVTKTCGADLVTFGVALFWLGTAGPAATLIGQPADWLRWNGIAAAAAAVALGAALAWRSRHAQTRQESALVTKQG